MEHTKGPIWTYSNTSYHYQSQTTLPLFLFVTQSCKIHLYQLSFNLFFDFYHFFPISAFLLWNMIFPPISIFWIHVVYPFYPNIFLISSNTPHMLAYSNNVPTNSIFETMTSLRFWMTKVTLGYILYFVSSNFSSPQKCYAYIVDIIDHLFRDNDNLTPKYVYGQQNWIDENGSSCKGNLSWAPSYDPSCHFIHPNSIVLSWYSLWDDMNPLVL